MDVGIALAAAGMLAVALAAALGPRLRIPAPLILVVLGIVISVLPFVPVVTVPPELVLAGILPPLLYSASVSLPAMELRRDFGAVSMLSVVLVVGSALALGGVFMLLIPDLRYSWAVALGAVISPTDAVATAIVKRTKVSRRVTSILDGESLFNDASALVLLRAAVAASAAAVSVWHVAGQFVWAVLSAMVIGVVVGHGAVWLRARVSDSTVNTVISFTVPFVASLPTEAIGGSGLVAAVAAGMVVGHDGPRVLRPEHRRSDEENWSAVSLILEGAVFLLMGLEIAGIVDAAGGGDVAVRALGYAVLGLLAVIVIRAAFAVPLLAWLRMASRRGPQARERVEQVRQRFEKGQTTREDDRHARRLRRMDPAQFRKRIDGVLASIDYLTAYPLGVREGTIVVWAGMRGAVTVAAAQTLPTGSDGPPQRSLLVLIAFAVAAISLLVQGGTLAWLIGRLRPAVDDPEVVDKDRGAVLQLMRDTTDAVPAKDNESKKEHRIRQLSAAREALLDARDIGVYDAGILGGALAAVDAQQIALDLQGGPQG